MLRDQLQGFGFIRNALMIPNKNMSMVSIVYYPAEKNLSISYQDLNHIKGVPSDFGSLNGSREVFINVVAVNSYVVSFVL